MRRSDLLSLIFIGAAALIAGVLAVSGMIRAPRPAADGPAAEAIPSQADYERLFVAPAAPAANPVPESGVIVATEDNFAALYDELYDRKEAHFGREFELSGYVMHQDDVGPGVFLIGRDMVACCEDDMVYVGYLVLQEKGAPLPAEDAELRVRGVLEPAEYRNPETGRTFTVPALRARSIAPAPGTPRKVYPQ